MPWVRHSHLSGLTHRIQALGSQLSDHGLAAQVLHHSFLGYCYLQVLGPHWNGKLARLQLLALCDMLCSCRAHRLAETCGAALPGELFHLTQPFKGHVCVADNLCEQKTNRPPLPSFQFLWLFFFFFPPRRLEISPETLQ